MQDIDFLSWLLVPVTKVIEPINESHALHKLEYVNIITNLRVIKNTINMIHLLQSLVINNLNGTWKPFAQ